MSGRDPIDVLREALDAAAEVSRVEATALADAGGQIRITRNVYELLVEAKRERNAAEADNARLREALEPYMSQHDRIWYRDDRGQVCECQMCDTARAALAGGQA